MSPMGRLSPGRKLNDLLQFKIGEARLLKLRPRFDVEFARACLDCGTLFPCLGEDERRRLAQLGDGIQDAPQS